MSEIPSEAGRGSGGRLFAGLALRWKSVVLVVVAATALALVYARVATPLYKAETRLLIEMSAAGESSAALVGQDLSRRIDALLLPDNLMQVATKLGLSRLPEFNAAVGMSLPTQLLVVAGLKADPNEIPADERVLEALRGKLSVHGLAESRVIVIEMSSQDSRLAAAIPDALAETYLARAALVPMENSAEIADLTARLKGAETRLADFRNRPDVIAAQNRSRLAARQLSDLSDELSRLRASRGEAEAAGPALTAALKRGGSLDALPDVMSSDLLQRLRNQRLQLKASISELTVTLLDNHPRLRSARSQLNDVERQIRTEAKIVLDALGAQATADVAREERLVSEIAALKTQSAEAGEQDAKLQALEQEADALRARLEANAARRHDASSMAPVADAHIFARAMIPSEPYFPKVFPIAGVAFAASLLVMTLLTFLLEMSSRRAVETADEGASPAPIEELSMQGRDDDVEADLPDRLVAPVMVAEAPWFAPVSDTAPVGNLVRRFVEPEPGVAPLQPSELDDREQRRPDNDESMRPLRSGWASALRAVKIKNKGNDEMPESLIGEVGIERAAEKLIAGGAMRAIFVSPEGDEAAAASILVAREVADAGLRVLLLDLTASGAASRPMLEGLSYPGITNLLASEAQFTDVIHQDHFSDCHVMPVGTADPTRAMRAANRLPIIMESLTTAYDVVVVECGPADSDGIARLVGEATEILVSVITADEDVVAAAEELKASGYGNLTLVTPAGYREPNTPMPGRSAA